MLRDGEPLWLRITLEQSSIWGQQLNISGTLEANMIGNVAKPRLMESHLYFDVGPTGDRDGDRVLGVELMTFAEGRQCSPTWELFEPFDYPAPWWTSLRTSLLNLSHHQTTRGGGDVTAVHRKMEAHFGRVIDPPDRWATEHADLHWANLLGPDLTIVDWTSWGREPYGYGAASLYVSASRVPAIAAKVFEAFADVLSTPSGQWCIANREWFTSNMAIRMHGPGAEPSHSPM